MSNRKISIPLAPVKVSLLTAWYWRIEQRIRFATFSSWRTQWFRLVRWRFLLWQIEGLSPIFIPHWFHLKMKFWKFLDVKLKVTFVLKYSSSPSISIRPVISVSGQLFGWSPIKNAIEIRSSSKNYKCSNVKSSWILPFIFMSM